MVSPSPDFHRRVYMVSPSPDFHRRIINTSNIVTAQKGYLIPRLLNIYPEDYVDTDFLNNFRSEQYYTPPKTIIQDIYGEHTYGSRPFGSGVQTQANITIQSITVGGVPCTGGCNVTCVGVCPVTVDIIITWTNSGNDNGTFTPWITIGEETPIIGEQITVIPTGTGITTFPGVILLQGSQSACVNIGTVT